MSRSGPRHVQLMAKACQLCLLIISHTCPFLLVLTDNNSGNCHLFTALELNQALR